MRKFLTFITILLFTGLFVNGQVLMTTTGSYSQDFNSLSNTGTANAWTNNSTLANWYAANGAGTLSTYRADNGTSTTGALFSYGSTGLTERALGSLGSGTPISFAYGLLLQNNSSSEITSMSITYVGEQWRNGGKTTFDSLKFFYQVSASPITDLTPTSNTGWTPVTALHFSSPIAVATASALNGNLPENQVIFNNISIPGLSIPAGSYIMIRWHDINDAGSDHGLAVDSLIVNWTVPTGGNTIATGSISGSPFTVSDVLSAAVNVPYTVTGTFNAGNAFEAYLSDENGNFAGETLIGSLTSTTNGTISASIPIWTPSGTAYRIRVKGTNPATIGTNNGSDLTVVLQLPDVTPPAVLSVKPKSLSQIQVIFDEALMQTPAETAANYTFFGSTVTGSATLRTVGKDTVDLALSTPLQNAVMDTLYITGIKDLIGNTITNTLKFPVVLDTVVPPTRDTIVFWNFPTADSVADGGITANLPEIFGRTTSYYVTDTNAYTAGATTLSISSVAWDSGANTEYWVCKFTTVDYDSIRFSSKQRSSGYGPRNFRVDYSTDGSTWTPVTGANVVCANNFTSGLLTNIALPQATFNVSTVYLRWIMTTDSAVNVGAVVTATGTSRIDDIYVTGIYNPAVGIACPNGDGEPEFEVYPNPATSSCTLSLGAETNVQVDLMNLTGQTVLRKTSREQVLRLDLSELPKGMYIIRVTNLDDHQVAQKKLIVQ